jgi:hypothetical protein
VTKVTQRLLSWYLNEPTLVFGHGSLHIDPKSGLTLYGPLTRDNSDDFSLRLIKVGLVGSGESVHLAQRFINSCSSEISTRGVDPILFPDYPGLKKALKCNVQVSDAWTQVISEREINSAIETESFNENVERTGRLFLQKIENLSHVEPSVDVIVCAIPQRIEKRVLRRKLELPLTPDQKKLRKTVIDHARSGQTLLQPLEHQILDFLPGGGNLRRKIKAQSMKFGIPTQLLLQSTLTAVGKQDPATMAWNFTVALYYKAGDIPWRVAFPDENTCYLGISFYRDPLDPSGRVFGSLAQVFSSTGESLVLKGEKFEWSSLKPRTPHMPEDIARITVKSALELYREHQGTMPRRLVVHKTSRFWPEEEAGVRDGAAEVQYVDMLGFGGTEIRLMRQGNYPVIRGTVMEIADREYLLYTRGFIPSLGTYPGQRIPVPVHILEHKGDSTPDLICKETLALTKMNWNSADFALSEPITLAFARRVGHVLAHLPDGDEAKPNYRFYM